MACRAVVVGDAPRSTACPCRATRRSPELWWAPVGPSSRRSSALELLEQVALDGIARAVADLLDPAASVRGALQAMNAGQFDAGLAVARLLPEVLGVPRIASRSAANVERMAAIAGSAGPWWALERLAIVSERPLRLSLDERGRLHSSDGPALAYPDGFVIWADHGVTVPEWLVTEPQQPRGRAHRRRGERRGPAGDGRALRSRAPGP